MGFEEREKVDKMGEISHINRINKFLDWLMIVSPRPFEMLKRVNARFNNQSLQKEHNRCNILITRKKARCKMNNLFNTARLPWSPRVKSSREPLRVAYLSACIIKYYYLWFHKVIHINYKNKLLKL